MVTSVKEVLYRDLSNSLSTIEDVIRNRYRFAFEIDESEIWHLKREIFDFISSYVDKNITFDDMKKEEKDEVIRFINYLIDGFTNRVEEAALKHREWLVNLAKRGRVL